MLAIVCVHGPSSLTILGELWGRNVNFAVQDLAGDNETVPEAAPVAEEEAKGVVEEEEGRAIPQFDLHLPRMSR